MNRDDLHLVSELRSLLQPLPDTVTDQEILDLTNGTMFRLGIEVKGIQVQMVGLLLRTLEETFIAAGKKLRSRRVAYEEFRALDRNATPGGIANPKELK